MVIVLVVLVLVLVVIVVVVVGLRTGDGVERHPGQRRAADDVIAKSHLPSV